MPAPDDVAITTRPEPTSSASAIGAATASGRRRLARLAGVDVRRTAEAAAAALRHAEPDEVLALAESALGPSSSLPRVLERSFDWLDDPRAMRPGGLLARLPARLVPACAEEIARALAAGNPRPALGLAAVAGRRRTPAAALDLAELLTSRIDLAVDPALAGPIATALADVVGGLSPSAAFAEREALERAVAEGLVHVAALGPEHHSVRDDLAVAAACLVVGATGILTEPDPELRGLVRPAVGNVERDEVRDRLVRWLGTTVLADAALRRLPDAADRRRRGRPTLPDAHLLLAPRRRRTLRRAARPLALLPDPARAVRREDRRADERTVVRLLARLDLSGTARTRRLLDAARFDDPAARRALVDVAADAPARRGRPVLLALAADPHPVVARAAAGRLGASRTGLRPRRIAGPANAVAAVRATTRLVDEGLLATLAGSSAPAVARRARLARAGTDPRSCLAEHPRLPAAHARAAVRALVASGLGEDLVAGARHALESALALDDAAERRRRALAALAVLDDLRRAAPAAGLPAPGRDVIRRAVADADRRVAATAVALLGRAGAPVGADDEVRDADRRATVTSLVRALDADDERVRANAIEALASLAPAALRPRLAGLVSAGGPRVRATAIVALARLAALRGEPPETATDAPLARMLEEGTPLDRVSAAWAAGRGGAGGPRTARTLAGLARAVSAEAPAPRSVVVLARRARAAAARWQARLGRAAAAATAGLAPAAGPTFGELGRPRDGFGAALRDVVAELGDGPAVPVLLALGVLAALAALLSIARRHRAAEASVQRRLVRAAGVASGDVAPLVRLARASTLGVPPAALVLSRGCLDAALARARASGTARARDLEVAVALRGRLFPDDHDAAATPDAPASSAAAPGRTSARASRVGRAA